VPVVFTDHTPKIDGILDDPAWSKASVISNFTQVRPREGTAPSERTEILLLYDSDNFYVGIRAFDSAAERIVAKQMQRDAGLNSDDRVRFTIDTFHDQRNGYYFAINANGAKQDGLIAQGAGNAGYETEWDGIWSGKGKLNDWGWAAEIAIPTKTLSFDPSGTAWGFNVERDIEHRAERVRWATPTRNKHVAEMGSAGTITEIPNLTQGKGIDFLPYAKAGYVKDHLTGESEFDLKPGFDLFYKVSPAITLALTVNTDFAEAEVDDRRVNLSRFPLFFDEKRAFFLQDSTIFKFGGIDESPLPFHSRRIGLTPRREPLDIIAGAKIAGRIGRVNFGVLNVQVDSFEDLESKNLTVARASANIFGESQTGFIYTRDDPRTNGDNSLYGYDFNFKESDFRGTGETIEARFFIMKSDSSSSDGDDLAFGATFEYPNDTWEVLAKFEHIEENFEPALGFVDETGTREYETFVARIWHPEWLDEFAIEVGGRVRNHLDGELIDAEWQLPALSLENLSQDEFLLGPIFLKEQLFEPFEIIDDVTIPLGTYSFSRFLVEIESSEARPINVGIAFEFGDFFTGKRTDIEVLAGWRPSPHFNITAIYETNIVKLPSAEFTVKVVQVDVNVLFSPTLAWNITNQWDNESNEFGINSRIRWTVSPGNDIYFVVNQGIDTSGDGWSSIKSDISAKVAWTFRF